MGIPKEKLPEIVDRIRNGSSLGQEAKLLGMSYRTTLISALRVHMGREAYDAMIEGKRPKTKSGVLLASIDRPRPDDAGLPTVTSMSKTDGWSWRYVTEHELRNVTVPIKDSKGRVTSNVTVKDGGERILIVIDPHGIEFVRADENEKADLLRTHPIQSDGPRLRFTLWESSKCKVRVDRAHHRGEELVARGTEAAKQKRAKANATPEEVKQEQQKALSKGTKKGKATAAHTKKVATTKKPVKGKGKKK